MKRKSKHVEEKEDKSKKSKGKVVLDFISGIFLLLGYILLNFFYYVFYVFLYETIIRNIFLFIKKHFKDICIFVITLCVIMFVFLVKQFLDEFKQYNEDNKNLIQDISNEIQEQKNSLNSVQEQVNNDLDNLRMEINEIGSKEEEVEKEEVKVADYKVTSRGGSISRTERVDTSSGEWTTFNVSAYCSCSKCCGKSNAITASGAKAKAGVTIAAPSKYAFGTQIYLEGMGTYTVQDRGGAIQGNKIDVYFDSHSEALTFGRKNIRGKVVQ